MASLYASMKLWDSRQEKEQWADKHQGQRRVIPKPGLELAPAAEVFWNTSNS